MSRRERALRWLLWSRGHFLLGVGGTIGGLIVLAVVMSSLPSSAQPGTVQVVNATPPAATASPSLPPGADAEPTPSGPTATMDPAAQEAASATAWSFVQAWLQGHGGTDQATWEKQAEPYAGGDALDGIHAMTRQARDQIPAASLATVQVTAASPQGALVTANLSDGSQLSLTLAPIDGRWRVTELDKADA